MIRRLAGQRAALDFESALASILQATGADTRLTLADVADRSFEKHVQRPGRRERPIKAIANYLRILKALDIPTGRGRSVKLGEKPIAEVTTADVDAAREARRKQLRETAEKRERAKAEGAKIGRHFKALDGTPAAVLPGKKGGEVGIEHMMGTLRNLFRSPEDRDEPRRPARTGRLAR